MPNTPPSQATGRHLQCTETQQYTTFTDEWQTVPNSRQYPTITGDWQSVPRSHQYPTITGD